MKSIFSKGIFILVKNNFNYNYKIFITTVHVNVAYNNYTITKRNQIFIHTENIILNKVPHSHTVKLYMYMMCCLSASDGSITVGYLNSK